MAELLEREPELAAAEAEELFDIDETDFTYLFRWGVPLGALAMFVVLAAVAWLAAPTHLAILLIAILLPTLFTGWYFGGIAVLTHMELRHTHAPHR